MAPSADHGHRVGETGSLVASRLQAHASSSGGVGRRTAASAAARLLRGEQHRVVRGGERRRVAESSAARSSMVSPACSAVASTSMRFAAPSQPGHLGAEQPAVGRVHQPHVQRGAARVVLRPRPGDHVGGVRGQAGRRASARLSPVRATSRPKTLTTAVPTTPRERRRCHRPRPCRPPGRSCWRPARAAPRPGRRARGVAARRSPRPRRRPGSDVRIPASTTTDRSGRCRAPAPISSSVAGRTPVATTTRSVSSSAPSTTTVRPPSWPRTASSREPSRSRT